MGIEQIVEDWPTVKRRWEAWWQGELCDRPVLCLTAPRQDAPLTVDLNAIPDAELFADPGSALGPLGLLPDADVAPEAQWTDADYMVRRALEAVQGTCYAGEALPAFSTNWAVGHALLFGCKPQFSRETVWAEPAPVMEDGYPELDRWRESPWWSWMLHATATAARASEGRYFVFPQWGNGEADTLALTRGMANLLMDIAENPGWVKSAVEAVGEALRDVLRELWPLVSAEITKVEGSIAPQGCWCPGRALSFDCDMSCMVSPEVFRELFLPSIVETMSTVDHRVYHLDGADALRHLDVLLGLPELQAIQWVPGVGHEEILGWVPLIQQVQRAGKSMVVIATPPEVEPLLREVRWEGLCISTRCRSEKEARDLLGRVAKL